MDQDSLGVEAAAPKPLTPRQEATRRKKARANIEFFVNQQFHEPVTPKKPPERARRDSMAEVIRHQVLKELARRHQDEYLALLTEARIAVGLLPPQAVLRRQKKSTVGPASPLPTEQQDRCMHPELEKHFGDKFCKTCGKKIM